MSELDGRIDYAAWARVHLPHQSRTPAPRVELYTAGLLVIAAFDDGRIIVAVLNCDIDSHKYKRHALPSQPNTKGNGDEVY